MLNKLIQSPWFRFSTMAVLVLGLIWQRSFFYSYYWTNSNGTNLWVNVCLPEETLADHCKKNQCPHRLDELINFEIHKSSYFALEIMSSRTWTFNKQVCFAFQTYIIKSSQSLVTSVKVPKHFSNLSLIFGLHTPDRKLLFDTFDVHFERDICTKTHSIMLNSLYRFDGYDRYIPFARQMANCYLDAVLNQVKECLSNRTVSNCLYIKIQLFRRYNTLASQIEPTLFITLVVMIVRVCCNARSANPTNQWLVDVRPPFVSLLLMHRNALRKIWISLLIVGFSLNAIFALYRANQLMLVMEENKTIFPKTISILLCTRIMIRPNQTLSEYIGKVTPPNRLLKSIEMMTSSTFDAIRTNYTQLIWESQFCYHLSLNLDRATFKQNLELIQVTNSIQLTLSDQVTMLAIISHVTEFMDQNSQIRFSRFFYRQSSIHKTLFKPWYRRVQCVDYTQYEHSGNFHAHIVISLLTKSCCNFDEHCFNLNYLTIPNHTIPYYRGPMPDAIGLH